jgi:hypothetical protein
VDVALAFVQEGDGVGLHLAAALPPDHVVALPKLEQLAIRKLTLSLDVTAAGRVTGRLSGEVPFGDRPDAVMPIAVEMPMSTQDWAFYGGAYAAPGPEDGDDEADDDATRRDEAGRIPLTLPDLAALLDLTTLASALPDGLHAIGLTDFSFVFSGTDVTSLAVGLASTPDWSWAVGRLMTIEGLRVAAAVSHPWQGPAYRVALAGRLCAGADGKLEIQAGAIREWSPGGADGEWIFQASMPKIELTTGVTIENLSLTLTKKDSGAWSVVGSLEARILDHEKTIQLSVGTEIDHESAGLTFEAKNLNLTLLDLPQCGGAFLLDDLAVTLRARSAGGEAGDDDRSMAFTLKAGARLRWYDGGELKGNLSLATEREHPYLRFDVSGSATITLPGPAGLRHPQIVLSGGSIEFGRDVGQGWHFKGGMELLVQNLADRIQAAMPARPLSCDLELNRDALTFIAQASKSDAGDALLELQIPLPPTGGNPPQPLGTLVAKLESLTLTVQSRGIDFGTTLALRLPPGLNDLFGRRSDKTRREVFVTDRDIHAAFAAGLVEGGPGFSVRFLDLPFNLFAPGPDGLVHWDLGEAGAVNFTLPTLVCTATQFKAEVELHEDPGHPLQIPLGFLKSMLAGRLPDDLVRQIPDDLPLSTSHLFDDLTGLNVDAFVQRFGLPDELRTVLGKIQEAAKHLPDRFKDYLRAERPTGFKLSLSATPAGSVSLDLNFDGPPLRVLLPALPNLVGLELQSLSFGEVLGGALFRVKVDGSLDSFDLFSLAACCAASDRASYLPGMRDRIFAERLLLYIVYETGIPIPVPLFCDRIGFDYRGLLGVEAKSSWAFPEPDVGNLSALLREGRGLWDFVAKRDATFPTAIPMPFALHESYISLPPYLGGNRYVGVKGRDVFRADASELFAHVADGIKFFSLYDALLAIPITARANKLDLSLGPVGLSAEWLICTAREFSQLSTAAPGGIPAAMPALMALAQLPADEKQALLHAAADESAAAIDQADGRRVVVLLSGGWALSKLSTLQVSFAFVAGGGRGFATGVRLAGQLANALSVSLRGSLRSAVGSAAGDGTFRLQAAGEIRVANHPVLVVDGEAAGEPEKPLTLHGNLQVLPGLPELRFTGEGWVALAEGGLSIGGRADLNVMSVTGSSAFSLSEQEFKCTESLRGMVFGLWNCRLDVSGSCLHDRKALQITGTVTQKSHLDDWAAQAKAQLTQNALKTLAGYRAGIAQTLKTHASESWGRWLISGDVIKDEALRSIDRYLAALEMALRVAQAVTGFQAAVMNEVARRLGAWGPFVLPLAFGHWTPSLQERERPGHPVGHRHGARGKGENVDHRCGSARRRVHCPGSRAGHDRGRRLNVPGHGTRAGAMRRRTRRYRSRRRASRSSPSTGAGVRPRTAQSRG